MKKKYRHVKFYIKTTAKNIKRHFGLAFSAATAVAITLILISIFALLSANLTNFTYNIEDQLTIRATIDNIVKDKELAALQKQIESNELVKKVSFHSGEEELESYKAEYQGEENLFSMYEGKASPIKDAFVIEVKQGKDIQKVSDELKTYKGIVEVGYGGEATMDMVKGFEGIRDGSIIFIIFLILVAALLISNKIKMSIYTRKEEIAIMRNVGASNWFIKAPMMLEGVCIGILGAIGPVIITIVGYGVFYDQFQGIMLTNMFALKTAYPLTIQISLLLTAIGAIVGLCGSFLSTSRFLRWKR